MKDNEIHVLAFWQLSLKIVHPYLSVFVSFISSLRYYRLEAFQYYRFFVIIYFQGYNADTS